MSRIGVKPIKIPEGVTVKALRGTVEVSGPRGVATRRVDSKIEIQIADRAISLQPKSTDHALRPIWGTERALLANMIEGVTQGFAKELKLVGTGYRAKVEQGALTLLVGFSHPVVIKPVEGIQISAPDEQTIVINGIDKALVGQIAAKIRAIRPPEPYKGKGIRYQNEVVKKKPGKAGKAGAAGTVVASK